MMDRNDRIIIASLLLLSGISMYRAYEQADLGLFTNGVSVGFALGCVLMGALYRKLKDKQ